MYACLLIVLVRIKTSLSKLFPCLVIKMPIAFLNLIQNILIMVANIYDSLNLNKSVSLVVENI